MHEENENVSPNQKNQRRREVTSIQHLARGDSKAIENLHPNSKLSSILNIK